MRNSDDTHGIDDDAAVAVMAVAALNAAHRAAREAGFSVVVVDCDELVELLEACDIYLTPYPNLQQSTSGTLSYAAALGRAIVSTPYVHACELLSDVGGELVAPRDPTAIAEAVNRLLDHPDVSPASWKARTLCSVAGCEWRSATAVASAEPRACATCCQLSGRAWNNRAVGYHGVVVPSGSHSAPHERE